MSERIQITINGFEESVPQGAVISELIERFQEGDPDLIVEYNGKFLFKELYGSTNVDAGDIIEFIHPNFGG